MSANVQSLPVALGPTYIRPAVITRVTDGRVYRVRPTNPASARELTARLATEPTRPLGIGDKVLLAGESSTSGYIIGVLQSDAAGAIRTSDGAGARLLQREEEQVIVVHDPDGAILFEYDPARGRSVVHVPQGDLQLNAPEGNIDLNAGKGIRCTGAEEIHLSAKGRDRLPDQCLRVDGEGAHFGVHTMDVAAGKGDFRIGRTSFHGKHFTSSVDRARMSFDRFEIAARRFMQRSEQYFHWVRQLCQVQAGRMRTLVFGAHHVQSRRTTLVAEEDVHIDGKKINLG